MNRESQPNQCLANCSAMEPNFSLMAQPQIKLKTLCITLPTVVKVNDKKLSVIREYNEIWWTLV